MPVVKKVLFVTLLFNLFVSIYIAKTYFSFLERIDDVLSYLYYGVTTFSHFFLLALLPFLVSLILYIITKKERLTYAISIILNSILIAVLYIDSIVFSQFRYHLSPIVFKLVFGTKASDIFQFSDSNVITSILSLILLVATQFFFLFIAQKIVRKNIFVPIKITFITFGFALISCNFIYAWADANYYMPIAQSKNIFPAFYPLTADNLLQKMNLVDQKRMKKLNALQSGSASNSIQYPLQKIEATKSSRKNILFIVVDTWRYDCMNPEITPNIYQFSKKSQLFKNHSSGSNMTTGGMFSLFYGIPATYFDVFTTREIAPVMLDELRKQNYEFMIYSSATLENPPFNKNIFSKVKNLKTQTLGATPSERDKKINQLFLKQLKSKTTQPFFGMLFYDSAHGFDYPKNFDKPFKNDVSEVDYLALDQDYNPKPLYQRYKNSLYYIDGLVGEILENLEKENLLENTIVVITGDHGQEFNDNKKGYWNHGGNFTDYQIKTPFMLFDGTKKPAVYQQATIHYDVVPTICRDYLGISNPFTDYSFGNNLFQIPKRDYFICGYNQKYAIIEKNVITNINPSGTFDFTDKKLNPIDPEQVDVKNVSKGINELRRFYKKK